MSGSRCPACGLVNFATSDACRRCGQSLAGGQWISTGGLPAGPPAQANAFAGYASEAGEPQSSSSPGNNPPPGPFDQPPLPGSSPPPIGPFISAGEGFGQTPASGSLGLAPPPAAGFSPDPPPAGALNQASPSSGPFGAVPPTQSGFGGYPPPGAYIPAPPPEAAPYSRAWIGGGVQQAPYAYPVAQPANLRQGMAITSLILGCLSPFSCALFGIGSIVGIVLGIVATVKAQRYPAQYGGKTMAVIGITLNGLSMVVVVPILMAIAIPNLLLSRMAANEASAIATLRSIDTAERAYQDSIPRSQGFANLDQLMEGGFLGRGSQVKNGYRFDVRATEILQRWGTEYRFEAFATPVIYNSTGRRSFYTCQDSVIRGVDKLGRQANSADPPIN